MVITTSMITGYLVSNGYITRAAESAVRACINYYVERRLRNRYRNEISIIVENESAECTGCNRTFTGIRGVVQHWNRGNPNSCSLVRTYQNS